MKSALKISAELQQLRAAAIRQEKLLDDMKHECESLKKQIATYHAIHGMSSIEMVAEKACEHPDGPFDWVITKLVESIERDNHTEKSIPVDAGFYENFEKLATARGLTPDGLARSPDVIKYLNQGINNHLL